MEFMATVRPDRLYVIADAPRDERDRAACEETLHIASTPSWPCALHVNRAESNLGCRRRISTGLDWVFEHEESAIVLEDDLLPGEDFFPFCTELLERYRDDTRIMHIGGNNHQQGIVRNSDSYYFSKHTHCWGWATWQRAWRHYDADMQAWPAFRDGGYLERVCPDPLEREYFTRKLNQVHAGQVDSWAFVWTYSCWRQNGLGIIPTVNLVGNEGIDDQATHTRGLDYLNDFRAEALAWPLRHPTTVCPLETADHFTFNVLFEGNAIRAARSPRGRLRQWRNGLARRLRLLPGNHQAE